MGRLLDWGLPLIALVLLVVGNGWGLFVAPTEREMGEVYRIIYVHVPSAWVTLLAFTVTFVASLVYLFKSSDASDALAEASAEVGVVFNMLLLITGSLWGKPTWGVYWSWDPRLTSAAIMCIAFAGYLVLRQFVELPEKRATWSAVVAIIIYADIPLVWYSVKWWNTLHQVQSTTQSMAPDMYRPLMVSALAFVFVYLALLRLRYRIARAQQAFELAEPPQIVPAVNGSVS